MEKLGANPANSCPLTPLGILARAAVVFADCPSVVYRATVFTWSQTYRRCLCLASALSALGVSRRDVHSAPRVVLVEDPHEKDQFPPAPATDLTYERLLEMGDPEFKWVRPASEWDPMVLNYPSGTTAAPKGVVHCHRGIFLVTMVSLVDWAVPPRPTFLWTLPMFHANGWSFPWGMAVVGATNVCLRRVDPKDVYAAITDHGVTHLCGAPVVLSMLANAPEGVRKPLHRKATKAAIRDDGWFYTGDVGVMHPDGYLEIRDRSKDVLISGGENISSVEVESMLYGHPAVSEASVVARPDEFCGETPCAFMSLKEDAAGTGEVFLPGQIFVFGCFALRANSLGHLEQIDSYAPSHQVR
uniref:AMP-dependent synthetase/ligase domain-containing protein n=1 Tax=Aegilops tauschii TaxID=37682 RepID=N1R4K4_AEGTA